MNIEFIELDIDWPSDLSVSDLRNFILSKLKNYGEPLRWSINSLTTQSEHTTQKLSIEAILIINKNKQIDINTFLN